MAGSPIADFRTVRRSRRRAGARTRPADCRRFPVVRTEFAARMEFADRTEIAVQTEVADRTEIAVQTETADRTETAVQTEVADRTETADQTEIAVRTGFAVRREFAARIELAAGKHSSPGPCRRVGTAFRCSRCRTILV